MRVWRCALATLLTLSLATGCSSVKEELKPVELKPIEPELRLVKKWSRSVGKGRDDRYVRLQPAVQDGVIYTVDAWGRLSALRAETGEPIWQTQLKAEIGGGVGIADGKLFVGTLDGKVIAISAEDGSEIWRASASSEILAAPQGNAEVVIASTIDGRVFAFNDEDGSRLWSYDHPLPVLTLRGNAAPLVLEDSAFVGFDNGQLVRFDSNNGQLRWSARVAQPQGKTELERLVDVDTAPVAAGPYVYAAGVNGQLVAVNRGTGRINWSQDASTFHNLAIGDGRVFLSNDQSHVKAYDASTGTQAWESKLLHRRGISAPGLLKEAVFVVDDSGFLHGLAQDDGRMVARTKLKAAALAQPVSSEDLLFVYDRKGSLSAFALEWLNPPKEETAQEAEPAAEIAP